MFHVFSGRALLFRLECRCVTDCARCARQTELEQAGVIRLVDSVRWARKRLPHVYPRTLSHLRDHLLGGPRNQPAHRGAADALTLLRIVQTGAMAACWAEAARPAPAARLEQRSRSDPLPAAAAIAAYAVAAPPTAMSPRELALSMEQPPLLLPHVAAQRRALALGARSLSTTEPR